MWRERRVPDTSSWLASTSMGNGFRSRSPISTPAAAPSRWSSRPWERLPLRCLACAEGDTILDFIGPLGLPSHIRQLDGTVVLVGGGLGVAPVFPQLREYKLQGNRTVSMVGFRNQDLVFWEDRFREFSAMS